MSELGEVLLLLLVVLNFLLVVLHHLHHLITVVLCRLQLLLESTVEVGLLVEVSLDVDQTVLVLSVNSFDPLEFSSEKSNLLALFVIDFRVRSLE